MTYRFAVLFVVMLSCFGAAASAQASAKGVEEKVRDGILRFFEDKQTQYFKMEPFNIPIIREGRVVKEVSLVVTVETVGVENQNKIIESRHKLQNAFLNDLHGVLSLQSDPDNPLNLRTMKVRLQRVADGVLGQGVATNVLVESAFTRNIH